MNSSKFTVNMQDVRLAKSDEYTTQMDAARRGLVTPQLNDSRKETDAFGRFDGPRGIRSGSDSGQ